MWQHSVPVPIQMVPTGAQMPDVLKCVVWLAECCYACKLTRHKIFGSHRVSAGLRFVFLQFSQQNLSKIQECVLGAATLQYLADDG